MARWYRDWRSCGEVHAVSISAISTQWLTSVDSMTQRLNKIEGKDIFFNKLRVSPVAIDPQVSEGLALEVERNGVKRTMQWLDGQIVWIYGQSVLMSHGQADSSASVIHLDQPIGDFLFYFGKYNLYLNL